MSRSLYDDSIVFVATSDSTARRLERWRFRDDRHVTGVAFCSKRLSSSIATGVATEQGNCIGPLESLAGAKRIIFTVVFYGLRNFGCKTTQFCAARRECLTMITWYPQYGATK